MKTTLPYTIKTEEEAMKFLDKLMENDEVFNPDDDAHDIDWGDMPKDEIPNFQECERLNRLMEEIWGLKGFDPNGYLLSKDPETGHMYSPYLEATLLTDEKGNKYYEMNVSLRIPVYDEEFENASKRDVVKMVRSRTRKDIADMIQELDEDNVK